MMRKIVFKNNEPSIDIELDNKIIENLYPVKLIKENIQYKTVNILLKMDYITEDIIKALRTGNKISLNIKTKKHYDIDGNMSSQDIDTIDNLSVVYSYAPILNKGVVTDYIFVFSTDENISYDMIMKLIEREEKQQLNSSIYKNKPTEIVYGINNVNGNLEKIVDALGKSFEDFKKEVVETMKI